MLSPGWERDSAYVILTPIFQPGACEAKLSKIA